MFIEHSPGAVFDVGFGDPAEYRVLDFLQKLQLRINGIVLCPRSPLLQLDYAVELSVFSANDILPRFERQFIVWTLKTVLAQLSGVLPNFILDVSRAFVVSMLKTLLRPKLFGILDKAMVAHPRPFQKIGCHVDRFSFV